MARLAAAWLAATTAAFLFAGVGGISNLCFDRISDIAGIYLQEHPVRNKAVVATQDGKLFLTTLPPIGGTMPMTTVQTYLDLSKRVWNSGEMGLHSFAFHPKFASNGRFFVTYTCDERLHPDCKSSFGCTPPTGCTVSTTPGGPQNTVIAEYSAGKNPLKATSLIPTEVRRVLTFSRPHTNHHGGNIFFGKDNYLYFTSGDGGSQGDPWNLAQNIKSSFGKLLRMDVDNIRGRANYSIPPSNPFQKQGMNPLVYVLGLRNPWRCDEDTVTGTIACGDVGANTVEEVNIIRPGGNYGWHNYEGTLYRTGSKDPSQYVGKLTWPLFSYTHADLGGLGCVIGGVFYQSRLNPCLQGKYLYADHSGPMWVATISDTPVTERVNFMCSTPSPRPCPPGGDGSNQEWGVIDSWGKDLSGNAYLLSSSGIFRVAQLSKCGIQC